MSSGEVSTIRVLCVDDEPTLADLVGRYLEREDDRIAAVSRTDTCAGWTYFEEDEVDAIVCDYDMPGGNGLDLLDRVRSVDPDLPFVLFTGKGSEEIASDAISRGVTEYMQKESNIEHYSVLANRVVNAVERYRMERSLDEERTRFSAVFDGTSDAMILADDDGTYLDVNPSACDLFGRDAADMLGCTAADFTFADFDFDGAWESFQRVEKERGLFPVERPDGTVRVAEYAASTNITPGVHLSLLRDITDQREAERRIHREKERLNEFAGILAHDLQNPVQVATGYLDLLAGEGLSGTQADYVHAASGAVGRIDHQIREVLALSRFEDGEAERTEFSLSAAAERVWSRVSLGTTSVDIEPGLVLSANEPRAERLLTNLFRNAIEHCGATVHVRVGALDGRDGFFVEDDGSGIPAEAREEVFDWQHSTKDGGTGIGLRSVRQIVEAEGWDVSISDGPAGGARFEIST